MNARRFRHAALATALLCAFLICAADGCERRPKVTGPAVVLRNAQNADWIVSVELAQTSAEQMRGLMFRDALEPDRGMLFIFDDIKERHFWMKNTRIPLDMLFITETVTKDKDGKPVGDRRILGIVENAEPYTETERSVPGASRYVLEVNGGACARHGIKAGDRIFFVNIGAW